MYELNTQGPTFKYDHGFNSFKHNCCRQFSVDDLHIERRFNINECQESFSVKLHRIRFSAQVYVSNNNIGE